MDWFQSLPPVTRGYLVGCVAATALVHFDVVSPLYMYLNFNRIYSHGEVWRLATNFLFFDYFSLNWVFHMIFLVPNAAQLEKHHYRGRTSAFIWMIALMCTLHTALAWILYHYNIFRVMFLGPAFSFGIVYVWSRKSQHVQMNFLGLFAFQAPFLPLVILGFGTVLGQSPVYDLMGIVAGHLYWFFEDVYPEIRPGRHWTSTPRLLKVLFDPPEVEQPRPEQARQEQEAEPQEQQQQGDNNDDATKKKEQEQEEEEEPEEKHEKKD